MCFSNCEGTPADAKIPGMPCDEYNHTHHGQHNTTTQQLPPPIYSTLAEGGAPADCETQDTINDGEIVHSAVVWQEDQC